MHTKIYVLALHCRNRHYRSPQRLFIEIMGRSIIDFDWAESTFVLFLRGGGKMPDRGGRIDFSTVPTYRWENAKSRWENARSSWEKQLFWKL